MSLGCYGYAGWGFCSCLNGRFTPVRHQGGCEERKEREARIERNTHNHSLGVHYGRKGMGRGGLHCLLGFTTRCIICFAALYVAFALQWRRWWCIMDGWMDMPAGILGGAYGIGSQTVHQ